MRIHFIAIGGSIMHSLALALQALGHQVTGSDDEIYEPSRSRLADAGILPPDFGWFPERITADLDLVVLGMHARADNPELLAAMEIGLNVKSFPEVVYMFSKEKLRVMVAGSHGKTTTSGMIAHALHGMGIAADRMIGAAIGSLRPVELTEAPLIVLEGDEYLTSPLDPRPKFMHYSPQVTVLTGIAWDHMNVFSTYADYLQSFRDLFATLTADDLLIYCADDPEVVRLVREECPRANLRPYRTHPYVIRGEQVFLQTPDSEVGIAVFGQHNLQNLSGALEAVVAAGGDRGAFYRAISTFAGAQSRLQLLAEAPGYIAYKDFAHAPSKVRATVAAVREKHPAARLMAILELHTFSSLNPSFLPQYAGTMAEADEAIVFFSPHTLAMKKLPDLSAGQLRAHFDCPDLTVVTDTISLRDAIARLPQDGETVMVWMSSGRFDGLDIADASMSFAEGMRGMP